MAFGLQNGVLAANLQRIGVLAVNLQRTRVLAANWRLGCKLAMAANWRLGCKYPSCVELAFWLQIGVLGCKLAFWLQFFAARTPKNPNLRFMGVRDGDRV